MKSTTLLFRLFALLGVFFASFFGAISQIGPAGVGNSTGKNGQPENLIWLDASDISSFNDGDTWYDKSGNHYDASHVGAVGSSPVWAASVIGGQPALQFDASDAGYLMIPDDQTGANRLDGANEFTIFSVFNAGTNDVRAIISKRLSPSQRSWSMFFNSGYKLYGYAGNTASGDGVNISSGPCIGSYVVDGRLKLFHNGMLQDSDGSAVTIPDRSENITIGVFNESDNGSRNFGGDIAEIIVFRTGLNTAQRILVESYLAHKYGISISKNVFSGGASSYFHDLAGVGVEADGVHDLASSAGMYLSLRNFSVGDYAMAAHNGVLNSSSIINTGADVLAAGADAAWNRSWYVEKNGTSDVRISFDISEGISEENFPQELTNYVLLYSNTSDGAYSQVGVVKKGVEAGDRIYFDVADGTFANGYYTLGTRDQVASPVEGGERRVWYSLRSTANWNSPDAWTLEPCGCLPNNPDRYTPITSPTSGSDKVVILSGKKMTIPFGVNDISNGELVVEGELDLGRSAGHSFSTIKGTGIITMAADNFPEGDASDFVKAGEGEGKVVFEGGGYTISSAHEFFNMDVSLSTGSSSIVLGADLVINGSLRVEKGVLSINDNTSSTGLNIELAGELYIKSTGQLITGRGNARHQLNLLGDFTNDGGVTKFTNRSVAVYNSEATDGIVDVNFVNSTKNQVVTCNGITNFYRLEVDKGVDKTYVVSINASEVGNFKLLGRANYNVDGNVTSNQNALGLIKGTVRLGQNTVVDHLNTTGNYSIPEGARLWVDGGVVTKSSGTAIVPYGEIKVSSGTLNASVSSGITLRENGIITVDGGVLNTYQVRTSILGATHQGGFVQSGGVVNVLGTYSHHDYYAFNLTYEGNTFQMSGGVLNVQQANSKGGIFINASPENQNVTGGTVNCNIGNSNNFVITSRAPFYNLVFSKSTSNSALFQLKAGEDVGSTDVDLVAQPLKVLNDFRIRGEASAVGYPDIVFQAVTSGTNVNDVYVGGSFFIEEGGSYVFAADGNWPFDNSGNQPTICNTTFFNQTIATSAADSLYWGYPGDSNNKLDADHRFELGNFVLDRAKGNELRIVGAGTLKNNQIVVDVNGEASVLSGTLDQGRQVFRTWGKIVNYDRMGTWYSSGNYPTANGTPEYAQIRFREDPPVEIVTSTDAVFGNVRFNVNPNTTHVALTSDMKIERMEFLKGAIYLKGFNLTVDNLWNIQDEQAYFVDGSSDINVEDEGISGNRIIYTDGKAGDGGLTLLINGDTSHPENSDSRDDNYGPVSFPVGYTTDGGTTIFHRPAQLKVKDFNDDGYVTIKPVSGALQTTKASGGEILQQYWRVVHSGFETVPNVALKFYYNDQEGVPGVDLMSGQSQEAVYVPGYVLDEVPYTRYFESDPVADVTDVVNSGVAGVSRQIVFNGTSTDGEFSQAGFAGFPLINANFTCGQSERFTGVPEVYFSRGASEERNLSWTDRRDWSTESHTGDAAADYPKEGDIAIIGHGDTDKNSYHWMVIPNNANVKVAAIEFDYYDGTYNGSNRMWNSRVWLSSSSSVTAGNIKGQGTISMDVRTTQKPVLDADLGDFSNEANSFVQYYLEGNDIELPSNISTYPNLRLEGRSGNRTATFINDIVVKQRLTVDGEGMLLLNSGARGDVLVKGDLRLGSYKSGRLKFNTSGQARTVTVLGDLRMDDDGSNGVFVSNTTPSNLVHRLKVGGDIRIDDGSFDLNRSGSNGNKAILEFINSGNNRFFQNASTEADLYRIVVNKGNSIEDTISIDLPVTLNGATDGAEKAIELQNGLLIINNSSNSFSLTSGGEHFVIPQTAGLEIKQGAVTANGASGIRLNGHLKISGGSLDMSGGDNPIIYSVSGKSILEVTDGTLWVGSQIRRTKSDDLGVLKFLQSGGEIQIGVSNGGLASRGMLEVLNTGSMFQLSGGTLTIVRQNSGAPEVAALLLDPSGYSTSGSTLTIFNGNTPVGQKAFGLNSSIALNNIVVNGNNNPVVDLRVKPLKLNGNLTIHSGATLDAKGLEIDIKGNWECGGVFIPSDNDVVFSGSSAQSIKGSTDFYRLTKSGGKDVLSLGDSTDITIEYLLNLVEGTIYDNGNTIFVKRDIINNGAFSNGGGNGVVLNGSVSQRLFGEGTYDRLYLDNSNGFVQEDGNIVRIKENLQLERGVLDIGNNLLVFDALATLNTTTGFSSSNMIQTNISFVDAGIKKYLPTGAVDFTYPLGSGGVYTPVHLTVTGNSSSGAYMRVKGANERHPSVIDLSATTMNETQNVLQYYWIMDANGLTDFTGQVAMSYHDGLVAVEPGYFYNDYISARILSRGSGDWNKDIGDVDNTNHILAFDFLNPTDDSGINGDYTAGIDEAIPDQVPLYTSVKSGDWNDLSVWSPTPPTGGPRGAMVVVNHDVVLPVDYLSSYRTTIDGAQGGQITIPGTEGHRLGTVYGTGTLYLETGGIPAGDYTSFFAAGGGTIEFSGDDLDYPVLGGYSKVNNLIFSGTGIRELPNSDIHILGDLTIETSGSLLVDNKSGVAISVKGDVLYESGEFDAGSGRGVDFILNGTSEQWIKGAKGFSGINAFHNLTIYNPAGVSLGNATEVEHTLTLTSGVLNTESGKLTLMYAEANALQGGSTSSFVEGPMGKYINNNEGFEFPIGKVGRYGKVKLSNTQSSAATLWEVEYFSNNPGGDGFDPDSKGDDLAYVSHGEYWRVKSGEAASAKVAVRWDSFSGASANADERKDLRVVEWQPGAPTAWHIVGGAGGTEMVDYGKNAGSITTSSQRSFNAFANGNYFTIGSIQELLAEAFQWLGLSINWNDPNNWHGGDVPVASSEVLITSGVPNFPVIDNSQLAQVNDLTINSGASLTMEAGARFTVNGDAITNDGLVVKNTIAQPSSLINHGSVTGNVNVDWAYPANRYFYVGHPVDGVTYATFDTPTNNEFHLYRYTTGWDRITGAYNFDANALEGYVFKVTDEPEVTIRHEGALRDNSFSQPINGWHLIGNPYHAYIDVENTAFDTGNALPSIWTSTMASGELVFITYNRSLNIGANGGTRYIAPGQAFWVRNYSPSSFTIDPVVRQHAFGGLKSSKGIEEDVLRLTLSNERASDEAVLVLREGGETAVSRLDSDKRLSKGELVPNLYIKKGGAKLVIGVFPDGGVIDSVELGYKYLSTSEIKLKATNIGGFSEADQVWLKDRKTGEIVDLRSNPEYVFTAENGNDADRFVLLLGQNSISTGGLELNSEIFKVHISGNGSGAVVSIDKELLHASNALVEVYDLRGEKLYSKHTQQSFNQIEMPFTSSVYLIKVTVGGKVFSDKVVVKADW